MNNQKERIITIEEQKARFAIIRHLFITDFVLSGNYSKIPPVEILAMMVDATDKLKVPTRRLRRLFEEAREIKGLRYNSLAHLSFYDIKYVAERVVSRDICSQELQNIKYALPEPKDTLLLELPEVKAFIEKTKMEILINKSNEIK